MYNKNKTYIIGKLLINKVWKQIKRFPNYEASNYGEIRNIKTKEVMTPICNNKGYHTGQSGKYTTGDQTFCFVNGILVKVI